MLLDRGPFSSRSLARAETHVVVWCCLLRQGVVPLDPPFFREGRGRGRTPDQGDRRTRAFSIRPGARRPRHQEDRDPEDCRSRVCNPALRGDAAGEHLQLKTSSFVGCSILCISRRSMPRKTRVILDTVLTSSHSLGLAAVRPPPWESTSTPWSGLSTRQRVFRHRLSWSRPDTI